MASKRKKKTITFKGKPLPKFSIGQVFKITPTGDVSILRQSLARKKRNT